MQLSPSLDTLFSRDQNHTGLCCEGAEWGHNVTILFSDSPRTTKGEREERERGEKIFEEMTGKFPNLVTHRNLYIQEAKLRDSHLDTDADRTKQVSNWERSSR